MSVLRNFAKFIGKHLCQSLIILKEALAQVFSCEFYEILKNTFFTGKPRQTAPVKIFGEHTFYFFRKRLSFNPSQRMVFQNWYQIDKGRSNGM